MTEVESENNHSAVQDLTNADLSDIKHQLTQASAVQRNCLEGEDSLYYDASTMASLNAFSAVSFFNLCYPFH